MYQGLVSVLRLISLAVFAVRLSYAAVVWFRKILADASSKPGDDHDADIAPRPPWPVKDDSDR